MPQLCLSPNWTPEGTILNRNFAQTHLMGPRERCMPVHVVFGLADIHHLVRVELEHALHLGVLRAIRGPLGDPLLLQKLPSTLALAYSPQVPGDHNRETHGYTRRGCQREKKRNKKENQHCPLPPYFKFQQVYRESSHKFLEMCRLKALGFTHSTHIMFNFDLTGIT